MNICVIGCGYVGLTTGTMLSEWNHQVTCVDVDKTKISLLRNGECPIVEEGLVPILKMQLERGFLHFSTDINEHIRKNEVVFIAVGTPSSDDGKTDMIYIDQVIESLSESIDSPKTIIIKSTVPPGTNEYIFKNIIHSGVSKEKITVISNPEFLREGSAVQDIKFPDKIVVGGRHPEDVEIIRELYNYTPSKYFFTTPVNAELIKYASNAFLATKISFINEMQRICEAFKGDINTVADAVGTDPRIGPHFLRSGLGYGGYCLPKDIQSLTHSALEKGVYPPLLNAVEQINQSQIGFYLAKIEKVLGSISEKKITIWGITFKPNTDDIRGSPSLGLISNLQKKGAVITAYDPAITQSIDEIQVCSHQYESVQDADMLIIATDWEAFIQTNWNRVKDQMKGTHVLDARNCLNGLEIESAGLKYTALGRYQY
jgi:UDPglucose 6-dehydrogenase